MKNQNLSPDAAVDRLIALHSEATQELKSSLDGYLKYRKAPAASERLKWRYPELRVTYEANGLQPNIARAYAKFQGPGIYATTVTQPSHFKSYLVSQLGYLVQDYGATLEVHPSQQEIPYPYVLDKGNDLGAGGVSAAFRRRNWRCIFRCRGWRWLAMKLPMGNGSLTRAIHCRWRCLTRCALIIL